MAKRKTRNPDHVRRKNVPGPDNEVMEAQLSELISPAVANQQAYYRHLGLRSRILNLPLMVAAVLTMLWRQVPSVHEMTRMLAREDLLWCQAVKVSQQALSQRFLSFPAILFEQVLKELLPQLQQRWHQRQGRPLPESVRAAQQHFEHIWVADGSTLEALFRKLKVLEDVPVGQLAGKIGTVVDLLTRLPVEIWFREQPKTHESSFMPELLALVKAKTLLILDRGFYDFKFFAALLEQQVDFITRPKSNAFWIGHQLLSKTATIRDQIIFLGTGTQGQPVLKLRLIEVRFGQVWYQYLTSVLDPNLLPPVLVADLYRRRWRIEEAFNTTKRLLNLSYLWTGSLNGIHLQIWATWLFYALLVDLGDAVADRIGVPFDRISLEMLLRGLYHFSRAYSRGLATDPVTYFADPANQDLDVVKPLRKPISRLDLSPFPI
ncbi:MAG: IS4 family transposase [Anaerolineae bacterium]|nr:IS4 family transposase [Anaerolineae bacterium]MCQ3972233.1 IS4 family transposase [Anaerolineae bacterium]